MKRTGALQNHGSAFFLIMPESAGHLPVFRSVVDLPAGERLRAVIDFKLFGKKVLHQVNLQFIS